MTDADPTCGSTIEVFSSQFRVPELARRSINPNLADKAVEEMHGGTGRWPGLSCDSPDGIAEGHPRVCERRLGKGRLRRSGRRVADQSGRVARATHARGNIIAAEVDKVIDALASQSFSRAELLKRLHPHRVRQRPDSQEHREPDSC
jgi:hypothetical protein